MFIPVFGTIVLGFFGIVNILSILAVWGFNPFHLQRMDYFGSLTIEEARGLRVPAKMSLTNSLVCIFMLSWGAAWGLWDAPVMTFLQYIWVLFMSMVCWQIAVWWPKPEKRSEE